MQAPQRSGCQQRRPRAEMTSLTSRSPPPRPFSPPRLCSSFFVVSEGSSALCRTPNTKQFLQQQSIAAASAVVGGFLSWTLNPLTVTTTGTQRRKARERKSLCVLERERDRKEALTGARVRACVRVRVCMCEKVAGD